MGFSQTVEWKVLLAIDIMVQLLTLCNLVFKRGTKQSILGKGGQGSIRWCFQKYQYLGESGGIPPGKHLRFIRWRLRPLLLVQQVYLGKLSLSENCNSTHQCGARSHSPQLSQCRMHPTQVVLFLHSILNSIVSTFSVSISSSHCQKVCEVILSYRTSLHIFLSLLTL